MFWVFAKCRMHGGAGGDVLLQGLNQLTHAGIAGAAGQQLKGLNQRHASAKQRAKLASQQCQFGGFDIFLRKKIS